MKCLTREEQRGRHSARVMVSIGLECHLRNLVTEAKSGDLAAAQEFQPYVQYAPSKMRLRIQDFLERTTEGETHEELLTDEGDSGQ